MSKIEMEVSNWVKLRFSTVAQVTRWTLSFLVVENCPVLWDV